MVDFLKLSRMKSKLFLLIAGIFVALLIIVMLQGCRKDEIQPTQMVTGGDLEAGTSLPIGWYYDNGQNSYNVAWTEEEAASPKRSLKISTTVASITNFAFWGLTIYTNIPVGKDVTLKVKIKSKLSGTGVSIAIRGDDSEYPKVQESNSLQRRELYRLRVALIGRNKVSNWAKSALQLNALRYIWYTYPTQQEMCTLMMFR